MTLPSLLHRPTIALITAMVVAALMTAEAAAYTLFESDPVRPIAASPDGRVLAVANTPEGTVEFFLVTRRRLWPIGAVPVGVEPVALAWHGSDEVWVVNHLSDSVSVIDLDPWALIDRARPPGVVRRTLLVGDEPRDIVFAGGRAFVTTAHRGQNAPDPQLTTQGVGRADVWVFDPRGETWTMGGTPETIITLFADTPRALATSPDGSTVYAAGFRTGNRTTTVFDMVVLAAGGLPPPFTDAAGVPQLPTGLIVGHDGEHWRSTDGRIWDDRVAFDLPDLDVFAIDATTDPPSAAPGRAWSGVGTVLYGMAVHPETGEIFVANTDANNRTRFEGHGARAGTVRGDLHRSQITVLAEGEPAAPRWLNPHLADADPPTAADRAASLATPMAPVISADGTTLYVAGFGSSAIGVYDVDAVRDGAIEPDADRHIPLSGGGPTGIVLDERRGQAYVTTRFDNAISIIDLDLGVEIDKVMLENPEPEAIRAGRRLMYDARATSANGEASCGGCHVFGDTDHLGWDLGNPDITTAPNPNPVMPILIPPPIPFTVDFQALKGPMTTQSMRGMANHGPMHWRGDRTGAYHEESAQPDAGAFDERAAFQTFQVAFDGLLGHDGPIAADDMEAFTDFALALTYPPNPIRRLDGEDTPLQARGRAIYFGDVTDSVSNCAGCHTLDPAGNAEFDVDRPGFYGTDGRSSFDGIFQVMKIPQLRNAYQKIGMFGMPASEAIPPLQLDYGQHLGDQIRGFGFAHDGAVDTLYRFFSGRQFAPRPPGTLNPLDPGNPGLAIGPEGFVDRAAIEAFVHAYPTNLAPIVGQQITLGWANRLTALPRLALMVEQAEAGACDLVAHARPLRRMRGALYVGGGRLQIDDGSTMQLEHAAWLDRITFTCVAPGDGDHFAFDRLR